MTQTQLFVLLLVSALLLISAARSAHRREWAMAALLVSIPIAGWASLYFGN